MSEREKALEAALQACLGYIEGKHPVIYMRKINEQWRQEAIAAARKALA